ncbi:MAG: hypothetical protein IKO72_05420 [Kiritimatiellae bacterium]|nr:hypothetical protein [Kiritimatiellia bacterium]
MNDKMKMVVVIAAVLFAQVCAAAFDDTGYVKHKITSDSLTGQPVSFDTPTDWIEPDGSEPTAPMPGKKYYVPSGAQMSAGCGLAEHLVFAGDELVIGGNLVPFTAMGYGATVTNLVFLPGGNYKCFAPNNRYLRGTAYIQGTSSSPMTLSCPSSAGIMEFGVNLHGDSSAWMQIFKGSANDRRGFQFTGTNENYFGTIEVTANSHTALGPWPMPAKVIVRSGCSLIGSARNNTAEPSRFSIRALDLADGSTFYMQQAIDAYSKMDSSGRGMLRAEVGDLTLSSGSLLVYGGGHSTNAFFEVTNSLAVTGPVTVVNPVSFEQACNASFVQRRPLIKLAPDATGTLSESDFVISNVASRMKYGLPKSSLIVENGTDGSRTLALDVERVVTMEYQNTYSGGTNWFTEAYREISGLTKYWWNDHEAVSPDKDYYIPTPSEESLRNKYFPPGYSVFPGRSLIAENAYFWIGEIATTGCYFNDLIMVGGSITTCQNSGGEQHWDGKLTLYSESSTTTVKSYDSRKLIFRAELAGPGTLKISTYTPTRLLSSMNGITELAGINTNFTGKIYVTCPYAEPTGAGETGSVPNENQKVTLRISDGRNLGGARSEFTYDAVKLDQMSVLKVLATATLDAQNRGMFVQGMARFDIDSGAMFTVSNTLTLAGLLRKEGEGTLALGGDLRFIDGAVSTAPLATTNVLAVKAGAVKPLATNVLDGAALVFAEGGKLAFDINPDAPGMKEFGFVGRRWATPIARADGFTGRIPVAFDVTRSPAGPPLSSWELGLVTVADAASAESIAEMLQPVNPYTGNGFRVKIEVRENADGSATVCATFSPAGTCLIMR